MPPFPESIPSAPDTEATERTLRTLRSLLNNEHPDVYFCKYKCKYFKTIPEHQNDQGASLKNVSQAEGRCDLKCLLILTKKSLLNFRSIRKLNFERKEILRKKVKNWDCDCETFQSPVQEAILI